LERALNKLFIKAQKQVFSELIGNNPSKFRGEGYDFFELREYTIGEDIRNIDWKTTAKMGKPHVKVFHKEHQINVALVPILNGSMFFGSVQLKQTQAAYIAALVSFSAVKNGDNFSTYVFADQLYHTTKPTKRLHGVMETMELIDAFDPLQKRFDPEALEKSLMLRLKRKSLIVLIGDFFTLPKVEVLSKKHEVIVVIVRDKLEEELPSMRLIGLIDPESGGLYEGSVDETMAHVHKRRVIAHDHALQTLLRKNKIRYTKIYTHEEPYKKLSMVLGR
jgi:uncharacterized protein (DUF58 family)